MSESIIAASNCYFQVYNFHSKGGVEFTGLLLMKSSRIISGMVFDPRAAEFSMSPFLSSSVLIDSRAALLGLRPGWAFGARKRQSTVRRVSCPCAGPCLGR